MQAEYQSGSVAIRKGLIHSFLSIFKAEGIRGLYRVNNRLYVFGVVMKSKQNDFTMVNTALLYQTITDCAEKEYKQYY